MKNFTILIFISVCTFMIGYKMGGEGSDEHLEKSSPIASKRGLIRESLFQISENDLREYEALKSNKEKYNSANKILSKIMLIFLADLGLRLENSKFDLLSQSQDKAEKKVSDTQGPVKKPDQLLSQDSHQSDFKSAVNKGDSKKKKMTKEEIIAMKNSGTPHPGAVPEIPYNTVLEGGYVPGEKEAFEHFQRFEEPLYKELVSLPKNELRDRFSQEFYWFQRVGNFRPRQKCLAIQKLQSEFQLRTTGARICRKDLLEIHEELWGKSST